MGKKLCWLLMGEGVVKGRTYAFSLLKSTREVRLGNDCRDDLVVEDDRLEQQVLEKMSVCLGRTYDSPIRR